MKLVLRWIILSVAVWLVTQVVSGITIDPLWIALVVGACLTLFNMFIRPIVSLLTLPLNIVTLGLFSLVINGLLFWFLGSVISGFSVTTFGAAFIGALLVSIINWLIGKVLRID
ncbi:MAG: phage holin family protein [Patescibacteria group bacterium]